LGAGRLWSLHPLWPAEVKKVIEEYGQGDGTVPESCQGPSKSTRIYNIFTLGPQFEAKYGSLSDDLLSKSFKIPPLNYMLSITSSHTDACVIIAG
jgi:hypothetical protein